MDLKIENRTSQPLEEIQALIKEFYPHAKKQLGFNKPVSVNFLSDPANSANPLGKTAHYDPNNYSIGLYVDKRHPKDVLRSFSHELVHHRQNCQGKFDNAVAVEGYAQQDDHLREMEKEAYLEGNMLLRDWEDSKKQKTKERKPMNEQKLRELTRKVIEELNTRGVAVTGKIAETESPEDKKKEEPEEEYKSSLGPGYLPPGGYDYEARRDARGYRWNENQEVVEEEEKDELKSLENTAKGILASMSDKESEALLKSFDDMTRNADYPVSQKDWYKYVMKSQETAPTPGPIEPSKETEETWPGDYQGQTGYLEETNETKQKPTPIHESVAKKKGEVLFDRLMNKWCK